MAGQEGIEPPFLVLETSVLSFRNHYTIAPSKLRELNPLLGTNQMRPIINRLEEPSSQLREMVLPVRLELTTPNLGNLYSIQLSYGSMDFTKVSRHLQYRHLAYRPQRE